MGCNWGRGIMAKGLRTRYFVDLCMGGCRHSNLAAQAQPARLGIFAAAPRTAKKSRTALECGPSCASWGQLTPAAGVGRLQRNDCPQLPTARLAKLARSAGGTQREILPIMQTNESETMTIRWYGTMESALGVRGVFLLDWEQDLGAPMPLSKILARINEYLDAE